MRSGVCERKKIKYEIDIENTPHHFSWCDHVKQTRSQCDHDVVNMTTTWKSMKSITHQLFFCQHLKQTRFKTFVGGDMNNFFDYYDTLYGSGSSGSSGSSGTKPQSSRAVNNFIGDQISSGKFNQVDATEQRKIAKVLVEYTKGLETDIGEVETDNDDTKGEANWWMLEMMDTLTNMVEAKAIQREEINAYSDAITKLVGTNDKPRGGGKGPGGGATGKQPVGGTGKGRGKQPVGGTGKGRGKQPVGGGGKQPVGGGGKQPVGGTGKRAKVKKVKAGPIGIDDAMSKITKRGLQEWLIRGGILTASKNTLYDDTENKAYNFEDDDLNVKSTIYKTSRQLIQVASYYMEQSRRKTMQPIDILCAANVLNLKIGT